MTPTLEGEETQGLSVSQSQPKSTLHGAHTEAEPSAAFTPGPWSAQPSEPDNFGVPFHWYVVRGQGRYDPAVACTWPGSVNPEGDARLISAAPDLLVALSRLIPTNVCLTNSNVSDAQVLPCDVTVGELRAAAAAIAKATGPSGGAHDASTRSFPGPNP